MQTDTPEGVLVIDDTELTFTPVDDGPELKVSLDPMPEFRYERGVYGCGTLVIGDQVISLNNEQATAVIEELRRPRASKTSARKSADAVTSADAVKFDSDQATGK